MSCPPAKLIKFPSIEGPEKVFPHLENAAQFIYFDRDTKERIYDRGLPLPVLTLRGTVKLHGANCAIVQTRLSKDQKATHFQSRSKIVTPEVDKDYMGFASHMMQNQEYVGEMFKFIFETRSALKGKKVKPDEVESIAIYGEWCGGNIQKNIGLSQFQKMFVAFAVKFNYHKSPSRYKADDQQEWMDMSLLRDLHNENARIFNVYQFETFEATIDFGSQKSKEDGLRFMEELTLGVQKECPVAKQLGAKGMLVNGEGIIWQAVRVASSSKRGSASILKLEKFQGHTCWMKTKDIKPALPSTSHSPKEQSNKTVRGAVQIGSRTRGAKKAQEKPELVIKWPSNGSSSIDPPSTETPAVDFHSGNFHSVKAVSVNPLSIDSLLASFSSIDSLVNFITPEWRMEQGLHVLDHEMKLPRHVRCAGPYVEWVVNDAFKEQSDRIERSGFGRKNVAAAVGGKATKWYLNNLEEEWWVLKENMTIGA